MAHFLENLKVLQSKTDFDILAKHDIFHLSYDKRPVWAGVFNRSTPKWAILIVYRARV